MGFVPPSSRATYYYSVRPVLENASTGGAFAIKPYSPGMPLGVPRLSAWAWLAVLACAVAVLAIAWKTSEGIGTERLRDAGAHKLDLYGASLDGALT